MTLVDEAWIKKVQAAHRAKGINCTYRNRGGKQYLTISYDPNKCPIKILGWSGAKWSYNHHKAVQRHVAKLFPNARSTSGGYGWPEFDVTLRLNP